MQQAYDCASENSNMHSITTGTAPPARPATNTTQNWSNRRACASEFGRCCCGLPAWGSQRPRAHAVRGVFLNVPHGAGRTTGVAVARRPPPAWELWPQ